MATTRLNVMHCSMQFSDSSAHKKADAKAIFARALKRNTDWITGTEANHAASGDLRSDLAEEANRSGYRLVVKSDLWIAVRKQLMMRGTWDDGFVQTLAANVGSERFSPRGIAWVEFGVAGMGVVSVAASHYMIKGQTRNEEYYNANTRLTRAIGEWGRVHGAKRQLCFIGADTNSVDRTGDVFRGAPFTTLADELKDWQDTGHGSIDVIASYDADKRVSGAYWRVLDDKEFFLNTDHFACEGGFDVTTRK